MTTQTTQQEGSPPQHGGALTTLVLLAAFTVTIAGIQTITHIVGPVLLTVSLAMSVAPMYPWLRSKKVPAWLGSIAVAGTLVTLIGSVIGAVIWSLTQMAVELPKHKDELTRLYQQGLDFLAQYGVTVQSLQTHAKEIDPKTVLSTITNAAEAVGSSTGLIAIMLTTAVFIGMDAPTARLRAANIKLVAPNVAHSLKELTSGIRRYWIVTTIFGLIVGVLDGIALVILGVPLAWTFAVLSFVTNYIPNIGFVIGLLPPTLMALAIGEPITALWVIISYSVLNFVIQSLIQPRITGDAVGLNATFTFISLIFWAWALGALGALLAVPLTLALKIMIIDRDPKLRWLSEVLGLGKPMTGHSGESSRF